MQNKICGVCGSSNLIADRSLGGKLFCGSCGSSSLRNKGLSVAGKKNKKLLYLILFLFVLILLVII